MHRSEHRRRVPYGENGPEWEREKVNYVLDGLIVYNGHFRGLYTVIHLLVVDVACVLFWTQSVQCMVPHQNTRKIYHKQMNNGVE